MTAEFETDINNLSGNDVVGVAQVRVIEELRDKPGEEWVLRREDFAPGPRGEQAFLIVQSGEPCAAWIDEEAKISCGLPPRKTVDFDSQRSGEMLTACSDEHWSLLGKQILEETARNGRVTVLGVNGFGRS